MLAATACDSSAWQAELRLGFAVRGDKTALVKRQHHGPLTVQRAFYPEGPLCHVYVLHPPGGIVGGDQLTIAADIAEHAQALITTPAAGKFYRSGGAEAQQTVQLNVAQQASLEWLPQETIIYQGAQLSSSMELNLADNARFIGWEVLALGRPAAGEGFDEGQAKLNWQIKRNGQLLYRERLQLDALAFAARWGMAGHSACGTLLAYPTSAAQLEAVQQLIAEQHNRGVTRIDNLLICRALDDRADLLRGWFEQVWALLREDIVGKPPSSPRIWAT